MAQLFGKWTIKENIQDIHGFDQSKIDIIQDLYNDYKNGLLNDEVKYKEKFNKVFFGDLLWYEDRTHRIPEWTISWIGNADLIFWNFEDGKEDADKIQIVCELKWSKSNLVKKQFWHWWLSPVWQWFAYKTWLKNCKWLIVSNFYEIRLYRDNQTDFEERNLQMLLDPKDDYFNLKSLFLLLQKDNLLAKEWISNTEKLLSHFREEQQKITKKFYKEYKELRFELIQDMRKNNPSISINTLVEKAQKIIDRLIFIFFCEDKGLLPDKKLKEWIERSGEFDFTPREMTKKFFASVDKWSEKLWIPYGYNGWLFKEDAMLNNLLIWDEICKKFVELTNYDFDDELSVNVLWHIFEQSISDLEELKEDLIWRETKDNTKWKRKKDWIFYTPEYIVDYIVQNSVMKYLNEKEDECLTKHKSKKNGEILAYQEYQQILQNIKVLDPACGSGAFLVRVFDVLFEENKRVGSILNSLFDDAETYKNIMTNNIYGVDLNAESVEITKLSLWLKSAQKGKKLNNLDANIKCGNSLIDDKSITDKAFDWSVEFPDIIKNLRVFIDNKRELNKNQILWTAKKLGLELIGFNIDGLLHKKNEWSLNEMYYDNNSPVYKAKHGKWITEHIPMIIWSNFEDIDFIKDVIVPYNDNWKIHYWDTNFSALKWTDNNRQRLFTTKKKLEHILGKDVINKHFPDFLILINSLAEANGITTGIGYNIQKNSSTAGFMIDKYWYYQILITDDIHWVFSLENRDKIFNEFKFRIIKTSEIESRISASPLGFDVIVGNPPYVSTKSTQFIGDEKKYYNNNFEVAEYQTDTYPLFVEKWLKLLKVGWNLWYIMPNSWLNNLKFWKLRQYLLSQRLYEISLLPTWVFEEATVDTINIFVNRNKNNKTFLVTSYENSDFIEKNKVDVDALKNNKNYIFDIMNSSNTKFILDKIEVKWVALDNVLDFSSWIKEYEVGKGNPKQTVEDKNQQKFNANYKKDETFLKHIKGNDIQNFIVNRQWEYLSYWPWIAAPRKEKYFHWPRLIFREIPWKDRLIVAYTEEDFTVKNTAHIWLLKNKNIDLKYLLSLLNSRLFWYYFKYSCWEFDSIFPKAKLWQVRMLKIETLPLSDQQPFIERADKMLSLNKELHELTDKFFNRIQDNLKVEKITKKLEKFYEWEFKDFLDELKKQKISLSLSEQDDREPYFKEYKEKILAVKGEIERTDKEIDEMVFDLYGLSEEERRVVEGE
jgi:hypothetical protein